MRKQSQDRTARSWKRRRWLLAAALLLLLAAIVVERQFPGPLPIAWGRRPDTPAAGAVWPWPHALCDRPHTGVTHWHDTASPDGTVLDLFDFDFQANPQPAPGDL